MSQVHKYFYVLFILLPFLGIPSLFYGQIREIPRIVPPTIEPNASTGTRHVACYRYDLTTGFYYFISPCTVKLVNGYWEPRPGITPLGGHRHGGIRESGKNYGELSSQGGYYNDDMGHPFEFTSSPVAQKETVGACNESMSYCHYETIQVKYSDILPFTGNSDTMVLIGATGAHPSNHHGTQWLNDAVTQIAAQYKKEFGCYEEEDGKHLGYEKLGVNDMSLEWGGSFDLYPHCPPTNPPKDKDGHKKGCPQKNTYWVTGHATHHRGYAVDFRLKDPIKFAGQANIHNSIIYDQAVIDRFETMCKKIFGHFVREDKGKNNEHIHCSSNSSGTPK